MKKIIMTLIFFFILILQVNASSNANITIKSDNKIYTNKTVTRNVSITNIIGSEINAISGSIKVEDESCVSLSQIKGLNGTQLNNNSFIMATFSGVKKDTNIISLELKTNNKTCSTNIVVSDIAIGFMNGDTLEPNNYIYKIDVVAEKVSTPKVETPKQTTPSQETTPKKEESKQKQPTIDYKEVEKKVEEVATEEVTEQFSSFDMIEMFFKSILETPKTESIFTRVFKIFKK